MAPAAAGGRFDLFTVLGEAGPIALATLLALLAMSAATWATWITRRLALHRMREHGRQAHELFESAADTAAFAASCRTLPAGPVPRMFAAAHEELDALVRGFPEDPAAWGPARAEAGRQLLTRTLEAARRREVARSRRGLGLLATVAATAPFVGLFGTVWGVIDAFHAIGMARSADLAVVAPGIAEALVATAAGLVAAIPAVWFHNSLNALVHRVGADLDQFGVAFLNVFDRAVAGAATAPPAAEG